MVYWDQMILDVSINAKQITKIAEVSIDLGKGLVLGAFALPALSGVSDSFTFTKLLMLGLSFIIFGIYYTK